MLKGNLISNGNTCEMVENGFFQFGTTDWNFIDEFNGVGTNIVNQACYIDISSPGNPRDIRLRQYGFDYKNGKSYTISQFRSLFRDTKKLEGVSNYY